MPGPLAIIGNPNTIFVRSMARHWHERGINTVIVTANHWSGPERNEDGVPVIAAERGMNPDVRAALGVVAPTFASLESELHQSRHQRVASALDSWEPGSQPPSLLPPLIDAIAIAEAVRRLAPVGVLGHEAFAYGLATALCTDVRRALFAWGADVLQFCKTSDTAAAMIRAVLNQVSYVLAGSPSIRQHVIDQFGVPASRAVEISLGVNRRRFAIGSEATVAAIARRYGIPPEAQVVMNVRRLRRHWGSEVAVDALIGLAVTRPNLHVIFLGGQGTEAAMAAARRRAEAAGIAGRFIGIDGDAPIDQVAELMSISDAFVSLTQGPEPLSLSVLQASACGSIGVVSDETTYRTALGDGLQAVLVNPASAADVATRVDRLLADRKARLRMRRLNERYIQDRHDEDAHQQRILRLVVGSAMASQLTKDAA